MTAVLKDTSKRESQDWTNFVVQPAQKLSQNDNFAMYQDLQLGGAANGTSIADSPRSTNSTVDPREEKTEDLLPDQNEKIGQGVNHIPSPRVAVKSDMKLPRQGLANGSLSNDDEERMYDNGGRSNSDSSPPMSLLSQIPKRGKGTTSIHTFLMAPSTHHLTMRNYESYVKTAEPEFVIYIHSPRKRHKSYTYIQQEDPNSDQQPLLPKGWKDDAIVPDSQTTDLIPGRQTSNPSEKESEPEPEPESKEELKSHRKSSSSEKIESQQPESLLMESPKVNSGSPSSDSKSPTLTPEAGGQAVGTSGQAVGTSGQAVGTTDNVNGKYDVGIIHPEVERTLRNKLKLKKKKKTVTENGLLYELTKDPNESPEELWPKPEVPLSSEEIEQIGTINGKDSELQYHSIETYFVPESRIRDAQTIKQENELHVKVQKQLIRLREQEAARRRMKHRRPQSNITLLGLEKDRLRSQVHLQEFKCWNCNRTLRIRGGGARYCEYTGKCYCARCHFGESAHIPARIIQDLDVERYLVCRASKSELDRAHEKPIIPRSDINPKKYFSNKIMQRLSIVQMQLTVMSNFIETCDQKTKLRQVLGSRQYLLYEDDLTSVRDMVALLNSNLVVRLEAAVKTYEKHITRECPRCCVKGYFCEYCKDPQPIFTFQIPNVLQCESCGGCFHTICYDPETCPKCIRKQKLKMQRS